MKKSALISVILTGLMLTACGSSNDKSSEVTSLQAMDSAGSSSFSKNADYGYYDDSVSYEDYEEDIDYSEEYDADVDENSASSNEPSSTSAIRREMLVYSCNMSVDTLDFQSSVDRFKASLDTYGGFVETENYSDGGSMGKWYYEDSEKWQSYNATVRVPCTNYEQFCSDTALLGELRSKTASVQNLTNEYYDLSATLDVYEAKEQRYIKLLADISEDEYAVAVEKELTEIQIEIARLRSRMNKISNDVAYSYVYITINEVKEYQAEPVKTDTFLDRLKNTLSDSAEEFLDFLEGALFALIYLAPYIVIIGIIVSVIVKAKKKRKAKKAQPAAPAVYSAPAPETQETVPEKDNSSSEEK